VTTTQLQMGATASIELPDGVERIDQARARALTGERFDKAAFNAAADADGTVARTDFLGAVAAAPAAAPSNSQDDIAEEAKDTVGDLPSVGKASTGGGRRRMSVAVTLQSPADKSSRVSRRVSSQFLHPIYLEGFINALCAPQGPNSGKIHAIAFQEMGDAIAVEERRLRGFAETANRTAAEITTELCSAIRACTWCHDMMWSRTRLGTDWVPVIQAMCSNPEIRSVRLTESGLDDEAARTLAFFLGNSAITSLAVADNAFSEASIEQLAEAAARSDRPFDELLLAGINPVPFTARAVASLVTLRHRRPKVTLGIGQAGRVLESRVAMASIENTPIEEEVCQLQRELIDAYSTSDTAVRQAIFSRLQKQASDEATRLQELLIPLIDRYCLVGGFHLLGTLPEDFKNDAAAQIVPLPVQNEQCIETALRYLLAQATYRQADLIDIVLPAVEAPLVILSRSCADLFLIETAVDAFLVQYELQSIQVQVPAYNITFGGRYKIFDGTYTFVGHCSGRPAWVGPEGSSDVLFLYYSSGQRHWMIGNTLGASSGVVHLPDGEDCSRQLPTDAQGEAEWLHNEEGIRGEWRPVLTTTSTLQTLRQGLVDFFKRRSSDDQGSLTSLLTLRDELVKTKVGPTKSFARALDKVRKYPPNEGVTRLKDLNRCTFIFDSPALLTLAFHLLHTKIKRLNGQLERVTNFFSHGWRLHETFEVPPCVHINVRLNGWIHEVMFMLEDFAVTKQRMHKFYEITRAEGPDELLIPIFPTRVKAKEYSP